MKKVQIKFIFLNLFLLAFCPKSQCQYGAEYLLIEPDARVTGMGGAGSAFANGASATYYNPAAMTEVSTFSVEANIAKWLPSFADDLYHGYFCGAMNLGLVGMKNCGNVGLGLNYMSYGEEVRTSEIGDVLGTFRSWDLALTFSYAGEIIENGYAGLSLKYLYSRLEPFGAGAEKGSGSADAFAVDVGFFLKEIFPSSTFYGEIEHFQRLRKFCSRREMRGLRIGFSVKNIGQDLDYIEAEQADPLPTSLLLGIGYQAYDSDLIGLNLACDYLKVLRGDHATDFVDEDFFRWMLGGELTLAYLFSLRYGYNSDSYFGDDFTSWGLGIGPEWGRINISFCNGEDSPLNDVRRYSLEFHLPPYVVL